MASTRTMTQGTSRHTGRGQERHEEKVRRQQQVKTASVARIFSHFLYFLSILIKDVFS